MAAVPKIAQLVKYFTNSDGSRRRRKRRRSRRGEEENIKIRSKQAGTESCRHDGFWLCPVWKNEDADGRKEGRRN